MMIHIRYTLSLFLILFTTYVPSINAMKKSKPSHSSNKKSVVVINPLHEPTVKEFFNAIKENDLAKVRNALNHTDANVDVNSEDQETGNTAFMQALINYAQHQSKHDEKQKTAQTILLILHQRGSVDFMHKNKQNLSLVDLVNRYKIEELKKPFEHALNCSTAAEKSEEYTKNQELEKIYKRQVALH